MVPFKTTQKITAIGLTAITFLMNSVLAYSVESNLWQDRKKNRTVQLAQLAHPSLILPPAHRPLDIRAQSALPPQAASSNLSDLMDALSQTPGHIRKITQPKSHTPNSKFIIHIQDIHQNFEAQTNIAKTISELTKKQQVGLIGLEGDNKVIDLDRFRTFSEPSVIHMVSDYLLEKNRISGPIHTVLTSPQKMPPVAGIDDKHHYDLNVAAYKEAALVQEKMKLEWAKQYTEITNKKRLVFSAELFAVDQKIDLYRTEHISFTDHLKNLASYSISVPLSLQQFLEAVELEAELDFSRVESERTQLLNTLIPRLSQAETNELINTSTAFKLGILKQTSFYSYFTKLLQKKRINLSSTPDMEKYLRYIVLSDSINTESLLKDARETEGLILTHLANADQEKSLLTESHAHYLVGKLLDFSLAPEEWWEYNALKPTAFIQGHPERGEGSRHFITGSQKQDSSAVAQNDRWAGRFFSTNLSPFENFYREAEARDTAMSANLLREMEKSQTNSAVLVTGGFHSNGMDKTLTEAGFTVLNYVPTLTKVDSRNGAHYLTAFTQERTPLEKLFQGEKLFLALPPALGAETDLPTIAAAAFPEVADRTLRELAPNAPLKVLESKFPGVTIKNTITGVTKRIQIQTQLGKIKDVFITNVEPATFFLLITGLSWGAFALWGIKLSFAQTSLLFAMILAVLIYFHHNGKFALPFKLHVLKMQTTMGWEIPVGIRLEERGIKNSSKNTNPFFTDQMINKTLQLYGDSLENFKKRKSISSIENNHDDILKNIKRCRSRADVENILILDLYYISEYFPLIYNEVQQYFTVEEFLIFILRAKQELGRGHGLLLWWPLIKQGMNPNLNPRNLMDGENRITSAMAFINQLILVERAPTSNKIPRELYHHLALFAGNWVQDVDSRYSKDLLRHITSAGQDFSLPHFHSRVKSNRLNHQLTGAGRITKTTQVIPVQFQSTHPGTCPDCQSQHYSTVMDQTYVYEGKKAFGSVVIVRVNGEALFSYKLIGDPSMVALKTMKTHDGRYAMIQGGVYAPSKSLYEQLARVRNGYPFKTLDVKGPIEIYPLTWIDIANNGNTWDPETKDRFLTRLSELHDRYSAPKNYEAGELSLLQGTVENFIERRDWSKQQAQQVRFGNDVFFSPLWEELVFRSLLIGLLGWNEWVVGFIFVTLHIPKNIIESRKETYAESDTRAPPYSYKTALSFKIMMQMIGTYLITLTYLHSHNVFLAIIVHSLFNWIPHILSDIGGKFNVVLPRVHLALRPWPAESPVPQPIFTDDEIDAALKLSNRSLSEEKRKLTPEINNAFERLRNATTKEKALEVIADYLYEFYFFIPWVYNATDKFFTLPELIHIFIDRDTMHWDYKHLLKYLSLLEPRMRKEDIQKIIRSLKRSASSLNFNIISQFYNDMAFYVMQWRDVLEPEYARALFGEIIQKGYDFILASFLPWKDLEPYLKHKSRFHFHGPIENHPAASTIELVPYQNHKAGSCPECEQLHYEVLFPGSPQSENFGKTVFIRIHGRVLFSLKTVGNKSMLALQTTRTVDGRLATIAGVVYVPPKELVDMALGMTQNQYPFPILNYNGPLKIKPLTWIDIFDRWTDVAFRNFQASLFRLSEEQIRPGSSTSLSLLQGTVNDLIDRRDWSEKKTQLARYVNDVFFSPLWEELVFRSLLIGLLGWNEWIVGVIFVSLHMRKNITHAKRDSDRLVGDSSLMFFLATYYTVVQSLGTFIISYAYVTYSGYWAAVVAHALLNSLSLQMNMPQYLLNLRSIPTSRSGDARFAHPERESNIETLANLLGENLPTPRSLGLRSFLSELQAEPDVLDLPYAKQLVHVLFDVKEKGISISAALQRTKLFDTKRPHVVILPNDQNTPNVRRQINHLTNDSSKIFIVVEGDDFKLVDGQVRASDVDAALQKSKEWRLLLEKWPTTDETINLVKPAAFGWVSDIKVGSPLSRPEQILTLEELLQALAFITSPRPTLEMLRRAAQAMAQAA